MATDFPNVSDLFQPNCVPCDTEMFRNGLRNIKNSRCCQDMQGSKVLTWPWPTQYFKGVFNVIADYCNLCTLVMTLVKYVPNNTKTKKEWFDTKDSIWWICNSHHLKSASSPQWRMVVVASCWALFFTSLLWSVPLSPNGWLWSPLSTVVAYSFHS